jgi:hypothetical protein
MDYKTHHNGQGGVRFEVCNPPAVGTNLLLTDARVMTYQGQGPAGMLLCTDFEGAEQLLFPHQIAGPQRPKAGGKLQPKRSDLKEPRSDDERPRKK